MGIQKILYEENYTMLITQSSESHEEELANLHLLENSMVDGIIISVTREGSNSEDIRESLIVVFPSFFLIEYAKLRRHLK